MKFLTKKIVLPLLVMVVHALFSFGCYLYQYGAWWSELVNMIAWGVVIFGLGLILWFARAFYKKRKSEKYYDVMFTVSLVYVVMYCVFVVFSNMFVFQE